jgi:hypothetical protein
MSMLNNVVGYWAYILGTYIWNEVSISTCGGLIHRGLKFGGLYSEVYGIFVKYDKPTEYQTLFWFTMQMGHNNLLDILPSFYSTMGSFYR